MGNQSKVAHGSRNPVTYMALTLLVVMVGLVWNTWYTLPYRPLPLPEVLQKLNQVMINYPQQASLNTVLVTRKDHPEIIGLFSRSSAFHQIGPSGSPDLKLVLSANLATQPFDYYRTTGELGLGTEWCVVPAELQKWLNSKIPAARGPLVGRPLKQSASAQLPNLLGDTK